MKNKALVGITILVLGLALGFLMFAGMIFILCWSFDYNFSWKYTVGIWIILMFVSSLFKRNITIKREKQWDDWRS